MNPGLLLAAVTTLGLGNADFRGLEPDDLLAAAFVARLSFAATRSMESASPEAVALEIWYPPVPAADMPGVAGPPHPDARRDTRYDIRLPFFRFKA